MASGKVHDRATLVISAPIVVGVTRWTGDPVAGLCAFIGVIVDLWINPDLDIDKYVQWPWRLYAKAIYHRHIWGHLPVLGTALRLAYLLTVPALLINVAVPGIWTRSDVQWAICWFGGWYVG